MIITQTGVSTPFAFAGTGDEYVVMGSISNVTDPTTATIIASLAGNTVTNNGLISAFGGQNAIDMVEGGTITNAGGILGNVRSDRSLTLTNTGNILGAIVVQPGDAGPGSVITNRGSLTTSALVGGAAIQLGLGDDSVINTGKVMGDINLGDGNNTFDGRGGSILGTVLGGLGDDIYLLSSVTSIIDAGGTDTVNARMTYTLGVGIENLTLGGFGNFSGTGNTANNLMTGNASNNTLSGLGGLDTLNGGNGADTLLGGTGNDSLDGGAGNDRVDGGYANDTVTGGDGNDRVLGDSGSDSLMGGAGNDTINGGIGADTILGEDGDDVLIGGSFGSDTMTGGAGADRFVFTVVDDSLATRAADRITDFTPGSDLIDLGDLIPGAFLYMDTAAFDGTAPSVRVVVGLDDTTVLIDLDGNARADMQINLTGVLTLTATDFVL